MWCYFAIQTQNEHPIKFQPLRRVKCAQCNILRSFWPLSLPCQLNEWQACLRQLPPGKVEPAPSFKQLPLSSRLNCLPVKCIYWSLVMRHKHSTRAMVELREIGK